MKFRIDLRLPSPLNMSRISWVKLSALKKRQRRLVGIAMRGATVPRPPVTVTIVRLGPRRLDDDNLVSSCKYVRDGIAEYIGLDDGSPLYTWCCEQRINKEYGVEVEIVSR